MTGDARDEGSAVGAGLLALGTVLALAVLGLVVLGPLYVWSLHWTGGCQNEDIASPAPGAVAAALLLVGALLFTGVLLMARRRMPGFEAFATGLAAVVVLVVAACVALYYWHGSQVPPEIIGKTYSEVCPGM